MKKLEEQNNLLIYKNKEGNVVVDAIYKNETLWLTKKEWLKFLMLESQQFQNI